MLAGRVAVERPGEGDKTGNKPLGTLDPRLAQALPVKQHGSSPLAGESGLESVKFLEEVGELPAERFRPETALLGKCPQIRSDVENRVAGVIFRIADPLSEASQEFGRHAKSPCTGGDAPPK